jgi:chromosome segregation ATPase
MDVTIVARRGRVAYVREAKPAGDADALNRILATTNSDVRMLRADVDAQRRVIEEREAALAEAAALKADITNLRNELDSVRTANQTAEAVIGELRNANIAAEARINELNRRTTEFQRAVADIEGLKVNVDRLLRRPPG